MENNEIMKRLMEDNHTSTSDKKEKSIDLNKEENSSVSRIRVVTAKFKVYMVILAIFICYFWFSIIPNANNNYDSSKSAYENIKWQLITTQALIHEAERNEEYLKGIIKNEDSLKSCLNKLDKKACSSLPEDWKWDDGYDFSVPLSYLQIHSLYNKKMPVDEKKVLKNLNEYLIREDLVGNSKSRVWDILVISIWDPEEIDDEHFFMVPVDVSIQFQTIWDLTWFLYNVEKKMIDNWDDRILYKIQSVSYDIISNDEPQTTDIEMIAYYYHDERFENISEESILDDEANEEIEKNVDQDQEIWDNEQNIREWWIEKTDDVKEQKESSSNSFFRKIFQS